MSITGRKNISRNHEKTPRLLDSPSVLPKPLPKTQFIKPITPRGRVICRAIMALATAITYGGHRTFTFSVPAAPFSDFLGSRFPTFVDIGAASLTTPPRTDIVSVLPPSESRNPRVKRYKGDVGSRATASYHPTRIAEAMRWTIVVVLRKVCVTYVICCGGCRDDASAPEAL